VYLVNSDYERLLERARSQMPEISLKSERMQLPILRVAVVGMRTIFLNFKEVAEVMNRDPSHLLKFLTREMATAATIQQSRVIFQGKFSRNTLERLINRYMERFVVCAICSRPDTKIVKEKRLSFIVCEACGAKSSVRLM
jgi:translation initiation factor 2 subunit 2